MNSLKSSKRWSLTLLLSLGFSIQGCDPLGCGCDKIEGKYFDIQSLSADNYKKRGTCCADKMTVGQEVQLEDYSLTIRYGITYFSAHSQPTHLGPFSLISQAYACDCIQNGYSGSKERLKSFTVMTLNDFDAQHRSNDTINDLLTTSIYPNTYDLLAYLKTDTSFIHQRDYVLKLKKRPATNFAAKITIVLQNGEVHTATTEQIRIL